MNYTHTRHYGKRIGRKIAAGVLCASALTIPAGCDKAEERYGSPYPCNFIFRADYHPTSLLARVLTNPGLFVNVSARQLSGLWQLQVSPNNGDATEQINLTTEIERRYGYTAMGAGGNLIIGCTVTSEQRAYDGHCRHCVETTAGRNFPLAWTKDSWTVSCAECKRVYNLNTGVSDDGVRLWEYAVKFDGVALTVRNN